eukprot:4574465-Ditylum_brightwellii.AAC.1
MQITTASKLMWMLVGLPALWLGGESEPEIIAVTANFLNALAKKIPSIVTPILDGEKQHHSKCNMRKCVALQEKKMNRGDGEERDVDYLKELNKKSAKLE